ncbi:MAG: putative thymidylate kinase [Promethearchaeota archaeon]|nr:MAG: putative thymidylate kinase [Candidatus Lokiarchaeota archaeon]
MVLGIVVRLIVNNRVFQKKLDEVKGFLSKMEKKGLFIVLDGIDGCGSTTHSRILAEHLKVQNYKVHLTHEPTDTDLGILIRKYLKDKTIPSYTDALLFAADRALHYFTEIQKKLDEGYIVISDRYKESSIVYQSLQSEEITVEWVKKINKFVGKPDITIILDIDPKLSLARKHNMDLEKFEDIKFLKEVRRVFLERAEEENYYVISSDDIIELVQTKIQKIVDEEINRIL